MPFRPNQFKIIQKLTLPVVLMAAFASMSSAETRMTLRLSNAETPFAQDAVAAAFLSFFGSAPGDVDIEQFGVGLGTDEQVLPPGGFALSVGVLHEMDHERLRLRHSAAITMGERSFSFADGFGIFRDPATIRARTLSLELAQEGDVAISRPDAPWRVGLFAGWGGIATQTNLHVRSALLDVRVYDSQRALFKRVGISASRALGRQDISRPVRADLRLEFTQVRDTTSVAFGAGLSF